MSMEIGKLYGSRIGLSEPPAENQKTGKADGAGSEGSEGGADAGGKLAGSVVVKDDGFVTLELSDEALQARNNVQSFSDTEELMDYLRGKYNVVKQGMKISIDEDGEMETESYGGWVSFNEGKRARQLAAAKTPANIQQLLGILQADLAECESGKSKGMCDDVTISKVKAMIAKAQQQMGRLSGQTEEENPADEQAFLMAGLM